MQKKEDVGRVGACGAAFEGHDEAHTKLVASGEQCLLGAAAALGRFYCSAFKDELTRRALLTFTYTLTYTPIEAHHAQCIGKQGHRSKRLAKASQPAHQQSRTACHAAGGFDGDKRGTSWRSRKRERVSPWSVSLRWTAATWFALHGAWRPRRPLSLSLSRSLYRSLLCAQRCLQEQIQIYCEAVVVPK